MNGGPELNDQCADALKDATALLHAFAADDPNGFRVILTHCDLFSTVLALAALATAFAVKAGIDIDLYARLALNKINTPEQNSDS
ncbi:hypothetical protein [Nocardia sp. NPDC049707]|uniref:hypothetical protein n=1 Tax=Nocardia sp. NPDC049707 TaxID=3154735 RepID=UPI0034123EAC